MIKHVNGRDVPMSAEEEAETLARWAANDPANLPPPPPAISPRRIAAIEAALIEKGVIAKGDIDAKEGAREAAVGRV